jgi:hypothetical protein
MGCWGAICWRNAPAIQKPAQAQHADKVCKLVMPFTCICLCVALLLQEKVRLYQSRFNLLYQRLRRNALFAPTNPVRARTVML